MVSTAGLLDRRVLRRLPLVTSSAASPVGITTSAGGAMGAVTGSLATTPDPVIVTASTLAGTTTVGCGTWLVG